MNRIAARFSMIHALPLAAWAALGCNGRLAVSEDGAGQCPGSDCPAPPVDSAPFFGNPYEQPPPDTDDDIPTPPSTSCEDGIRNGDEGDIDCGGPCAPCASGSSCTRHTDCRSEICRAGICASTTCEDGIQNGSETGVDCGGACARCRTESCRCAQSPELSALSCDETLGYRDERAPIVAADGQTALYATCYSAPNGPTPCYVYRWTRAGGAEQLSTRDSSAWGISDDGQTLLYAEESGPVLQRVGSPAVEVELQVGARLSADGTQVIGITNEAQGTQRVARWSSAAGLETLAALPDGALGGEVVDVSGDASVVVGHSYDNSGNTPFRWTEAGGLQALEVVTGPSVSGARPLGLSRDGAVVVGMTGRFNTAIDFVRWTEGDGMRVLGPAFQPTPTVPRLFINTDGSVIAGTSRTPGTSAVRWTFPGDATVLFEDGELTDMNASGSLLVGLGPDTRPLLWAAGAVVDLAAQVVTRAIDARGWELRTPSYVAEDGSFIFGFGTCDGTPVTYRLEL